MPATNTEPYTVPDPEWVELTELPDLLGKATPSSSLFHTLLESYRQEGYEQGRTQALRDLESAFVPVAESFLRSHRDAPPELRRFIYSFIARVQRETTWHAREPFVEGGLGI